MHACVVGGGGPPLCSLTLTFPPHLCTAEASPFNKHRLSVHATGQGVREHSSPSSCPCSTCSRRSSGSNSNAASVPLPCRLPILPHILVMQGLSSSLLSVDLRLLTWGESTCSWQWRRQCSSHPGHRRQHLRRCTLQEEGREMGWKKVRGGTP